MGESYGAVINWGEQGEGSLFLNGLETECETKDDTFTKKTKQS